MGEPPDLPATVSATPELRLMMHEALLKLPPRYRAVLVLRFWENRTVEQTAQALQVTPGTVKSQSARGLARLREIVERLAGERTGR
ncbi:Sigma-70 (fragment) [Streptantibioticus cattleyicolor NRRL 8057 = DSM 46488]